MKPLVRWLLLVPMVVTGLLSVGGLYWLGHNFLLWMCPTSFQSAEGTTDLAERDYGVVVSTCSASWYPGAEAALLLSIILLAVVVCSAVSYFVAPSKKPLACAISGGLVSAALALAFFWPLS